jgi:hypothetical protein
MSSRYASAALTKATPTHVRPVESCVSKVPVPLTNKSRVFDRMETD